MARGSNSNLLVSSITVGWVVERERIPSIRLITIDSEGAEESLLRRVRQTLEERRPHVMIETLRSENRRAIDTIQFLFGSSGTPIDAHNARC